MIEEIIYKAFDRLESNNFATLGKAYEAMWERPLIGVAAGDDPYYDFLKEHIGPIHWTPVEVFAQKYEELPSADKLRVIAMAFPQTDATMKMQEDADVFPSDRWLVSRGEWEPMIRDFCRDLEGELEKAGIRAVFPDLLPDFGMVRTASGQLASNWSQRHTAYAAGLGTFGLSDGFITRQGIAIRITSAVIEADIPVNAKTTEDPYGWCTRCGACIRRCPVAAISLEGGHDKEKCAAYEDYCIENLWPDHIERGDYIFGCGLCQAGVPCSSRFYTEFTKD